MVSNLHHDLPRDGRPAYDPGGDAREVARTLRRAGPLEIAELQRQPELEGWSASRVESAVVSAWADNLIFFDTRDQLVAI